MKFIHQQETLAALADILGANLLGIYLYGSILNGTPKPLSDVDHWQAHEVNTKMSVGFRL